MDSSPWVDRLPFCVPSTTTNKGSLTPWLLLAITAIAVAAPFLLISRAKEIVAWRTDVDAAFAEAKAANKPLLIDVTADWCPPCKVMKREVFSKERVKAAIEAGFMPLRLDVTERNAHNAKLSERFAVEFLPTYLIIAADGVELRREVGILDEDRFVKWLGHAD